MNAWDKSVRMGSLGLALILCLAWATPLQAFLAKTEITFDDIIERARKRAQEEYRAPSAALPESLMALDYDDYRRIQWQRDETLWAQDHLRFELQLFHPGYLFKQPVRIYEFTATHAQEIPFTPAFFQYDTDLKLDERKLREDIGYAGFKLLFPLNDSSKFDEVISFLGSNYFRALGAGQRYGKSARGIALNTGLPVPEEFPDFREFWIRKPEFGSMGVMVYAVMDSPSVAGAYAFRVVPGEETVVQVESVLFFRKVPERVGLAPLSSMYWYSEVEGRPQGDFRPEVHDSDGLLVQNAAGEWLWKPVLNDGGVREYALELESPQGFGLVQRDREFGHYEDLEAYYQARPSVWITPSVDRWKSGKVVLVELPTDNEYQDNIVSFWEPDQKPVVGEPYRFSYKLEWTQSVPNEDRMPVVANRRQETDTGTRWVLDFEDGDMEGGAGAPEVVASVPDGVAVKSQVIANPMLPGWRVILDVRGHGDGRIQCKLTRDGAIVSETWWTQL